MAGYDKITVKDFSKKLDDNGYSSLIGARRAIGRMTTWTGAQRNKARSIAAKYFGEEIPPEAAKKTSKKTKKKAAKKGLAASPPKKEAKKTVKKTKTRSVKVSTQSAGSSKAGVKKSSGKKAKGGGVSPSTQQETVHDKLDVANAKTNAMRNVLDQVERTKSLGAPESDVAAGAKKAQAGLSRIIDEICALTDQIVNEPSEVEVEAADDFAKAARASSPGGNGVTSKTTTTTPSPSPPIPPLNPPQSTP